MTGDDNRKHWHVAFVKGCQEKKMAALLSGMGIENYLPVHREFHKWTDRRKLIEKLVLPRMIFIRTTEKDRAIPLQASPYIYKYLVDAPGHPAVVRDGEMEVFRAMVEQSERPVDFLTSPIVAGDRVEVMSGPLKGLECDIVSVSGEWCYAARLGLLGTLTVELSLDTVRRIDKIK